MQRLRPELLGHAAELARQVRGGTFDEWISYFDWKYLRNPYIAEPLFHVAVADDHALGMRGFFGTCWEAGSGGRRHVLPAAGDSTIPEEHRDEHLYRSLGEVMLDDARAHGFTHVINTSASTKTALTAMLTFGWKAVVPRDVLTTQAPPQAAHGLRRQLDRLPAPVRKLIRRVRALTRTAPRPAFAGLDRTGSGQGAAGEPELRVTTSADELADIAARAGADGRLRPVRDAEYFRWRLSNPRSEYRVLVTDDDDGCGYLILCRKPHVVPVFVLDWQGTSERHRGALVSHALAHLKAVNIWSGSLSEAELETLQAQAFARRDVWDASERRRKALLARPLADPGVDAHWVLDGIRLDDAGSWHVHAINSDTY